MLTLCIYIPSRVKLVAKIFKEAWLDTNGQPWLVNALAHGMTWEDKTGDHLPG